MMDANALNAATIELELKKMPVDDETPQYVINENKNGKNKVIWSKFGIVHYKGQKLDFACCKNCKAVYTFKASTGTSTIAKHVCTKLPAKSGAMNLFARQGKAATCDKKKMTKWPISALLTCAHSKPSQAVDLRH